VCRKRRHVPSGRCTSPISLPFFCHLTLLPGCLPPCAATEDVLEELLQQEIVDETDQ
jgi:hypothetical protein